MAVTSLSNPASSTSGLETITSPAGINSGDVLIFYDYASKTGSPAPSAVTPSGFTLIGTTASSFARTSLYYKIADGTEDSTSYTGMTGNDSIQKIFAVFRGDVAITAVTAGSYQGTVTDSNPAAQTTVASGGAAPLFCIAGMANGNGASAISPRTYTPSMTAEIANGTHQYLSWIFYASSPADQLVDMADEGLNNSVTAAYLELTGAAAAYTSRFLSVF